MYLFTCLVFFFLFILFSFFFFFFFFNDTATTEIYTLSLHDALPIWRMERERFITDGDRVVVLIHLVARGELSGVELDRERSEEHTSELQSRRDLVCRLLLEKKKKKKKKT